MSQLAQMLTAEAMAYLAAVDTFRENDAMPEYRPESSEDLERRSLSRREIRAEVNHYRERETV